LVDYRPPKGIGEEKMLFIRYSALGDIVRAIPYVATIKETFPSLHITWLLTHPYEDLMKGQPFVDDVIVWYRGLGCKGFLNIISKIRKSSFTHLVSLQGTDRSAVIALLSGIENRAGRHDWASFVYNLPREDLQEILGRTIKIDKYRRYYKVNQKLKSLTDALLKDLNRPRIACVIGASKKVKRWPVSNWVGFITMITSFGGSAILLGHGSDEEALAQTIEDSLQEKHNHKILNLVSKLRLNEMAALIDGCDYVVGGDTGPMHLALALQKPAIGLFGPTLPEQVGLSDIRFKLIVDCPLKGCQKWGCNRRCLSSVRPERVFEIIKGDCVW